MCYPEHSTDAGCWSRMSKKRDYYPIVSMACSGVFVFWFCVDIQGLGIDHNTQNILK